MKHPNRPAYAEFPEGTKIEVVQHPRFMETEDWVIGAQGVVTNNFMLKKGWHPDYGNILVEVVNSDPYDYDGDAFREVYVFPEMLKVLA